MSEIKIVFGGDVSPGTEEGFRGLAESGSLWSPLLRKAVGAADLIVINLETVLGNAGVPRPKIGAHLKSDVRTAAVLARSGVKLVTLANNHIFDFGVEGLESTRKSLLSAGIDFMGTGQTPQDASVLKIAEIKGRKIGFLVYAEHEFNYLSEKEPSTAVLNPCRNILEIQKARSQCDHLFIFTHIGPEGHDVPSPRMKNIFHCFAEAGASAVINSHAHMVMGMEMYQGVPIYYGLGNLFFPRPGRMDDWWYNGMLTEITIADSGLSCRNIFTSFRNGTCVDLASDADLAEQNFDRISSLILDDDVIFERWLAFCKKQRKHLFKQIIKGGAALCIGSLHNKLLLKKKSWKNDHSLAAKGVRMFRGLLMCENHVDEFREIFNDFMRNGF